MAWPPSLPSTGFKSQGVATFVWGTQGFQAASAAVSSYIIKSVRVEERTEEPVIENGDGLTATQIQLLDGLNYEITVVDNTAVVPPVAGQVGNVVIPQLGVNGTVNNNAVPALFMAEVISLGRKTDGERVMRLKQFTLFTPS